MIGQVTVANSHERTEDRFKATAASWQSSIAMAAVYAAVLCASIAFLPSQVFDSTSDRFILAIGLIGMWRYGWWFTHYLRASAYRGLRFPKLRRVATEVTDRGFRPDHIYVLCTSYRIEPSVTYAVYEGLIRNALDYGVRTTVFAAISDRTDVDVLGQLLDDYGHPDLIEFRYMFQRGDGKRSAMAEVLRAISRCEPGPNDLVVFMDGDIRLPASTFRRSMPFFFFEHDLGAVTTNNKAIVDGGNATKEWYDLRYAQRHLLMCSTSLSRRVLVLTGRFSVIRADLCTCPDFIRLVERDQLAHRRFGTFALLSGDDKSTWYWLLKNNWAMRYIPDVRVYGFESLPQPRRFVASTISLMRRWFGNMFRTSGRAIALGPRNMGFFTWWCLVDQRLSVWTTLIGPTVAVVLTIFIRPSFAIAYLLWVMSTRLLASTLLGLSWGRMSPYWPVLLYYNQVGGAALKSSINFRYNQQKWTRQGIEAQEAADPRTALRVRRESAALHMAAIMAIVAAICFSTGTLGLPDRHSWQSIVAGKRPQTGDYWLNASIKATPEGSPVFLPPEHVVAQWQTLDRASSIYFHGAGPDRTELRIIQVPAAISLARGAAHTEGVARIRCGRGPDACRIGDRMLLTNLTLVTEQRRNSGTMEDR
jgi:glycosyltransferase Alg8